MPTHHQERRPDRPLRGLTILLALLGSAFCIHTFVMAPAVLLLLVPLTPCRRLLRWWSSAAAGQWLSFGAWLLEVVGGVRVVATGDLAALRERERVLITSNHRTRIDWMFLWCLAARLNAMNAYRVILKAELKSYPWWGWGMAQCCFFFVRRGSKYRGQDLARVRGMSRYLLRLGVPNALILFPEGTDLSPSNQERDAAFAAQQGLDRYHHVLHPRAGAFTAAMGVLAPRLDALYDLTMAYRDYQPGERPSELSMLRGRLPREVYIHIRRVPAASLPKDGPQCEAFLKDSFDRKERVLTRFYSRAAQQQGDDDDEETRARLLDDEEQDGKGKAKGMVSAEDSIRLRRHYDRVAARGHRGGLLFTLLVVCGVVALARRLPARVFWGYVLVESAATVLINKVVDGVDSLELRLAGETGEGDTKEKKKEKD